MRPGETDLQPSRLEPDVLAGGAQVAALAKETKEAGGGGHGQRGGRAWRGRGGKGGQGCGRKRSNAMGKETSHTHTYMLVCNLTHTADIVLLHGEAVVPSKAERQTRARCAVRCAADAHTA